MRRVVTVFGQIVKLYFSLDYFFVKIAFEHRQRIIL